MKYVRPPFGDPDIPVIHRTSPFRAGGFDVPAVKDRPIPIRDNFRLAAQCRKPFWVPNSNTDFNFAMLYMVSGMPEYCSTNHIV